MAEVGSYEEFYKPRNSHETFRDETSTLYISRIQEALEMANSLRRPNAPLKTSFCPRSALTKLQKLYKISFTANNNLSQFYQNASFPAKIHHFYIMPSFL